MYNSLLTKYNFKGAHKAGICGKCGIEYNLNTITEKQIELMIKKGSPLFELKPEAEATEGFLRPEVEAETGNGKTKKGAKGKGKK